MDPYLEHPTLWPDVHNRLLVALGDDLSPRLAPRYYIGVEHHTYVVDANSQATFLGRPDLVFVPKEPLGSTSRLPLADVDVLEIELPLSETVEQAHLEVRGVPSGEVVTVIELLSPANKVGTGRDEYLKKRDRILHSTTNLVELDLLRGGEPLPTLTPAPRRHYRFVISRATRHPYAQLYAFNMQHPLPTFALPLRPKEAEIAVDIGAILRALYARVRFDLALDYTRPAVPPLEAEDAAWADGLIQQWRTAQGK